MNAIGIHICALAIWWVGARGRLRECGGGVLSTVSG
jgi:hypothetical protein